MSRWTFVAGHILLLGVAGRALFSMFLQAAGVVLISSHVSAELPGFVSHQCFEILASGDHDMVISEC